MKKFLLLLSISMVSCPAFASALVSAEALYKTAVRHERRGKLEEARQNLLWLASYYSESPLATRARDEIGAIYLFEDGQARVRDGRYGCATVTFRTVAQVYPESPLARQAEAASRSAERKEEQSGGPIVRSLTFRNTGPASVSEILNRLQQREVGLAVEQPFHDEDIYQARQVISELMAEKGVQNANVRAEIRPASNNRVRVEFTVR
jgi:Surface antigen variable number repeat